MSIVLYFNMYLSIEFCSMLCNFIWKFETNCHMILMDARWAHRARGPQVSVGPWANVLMGPWAHGLMGSLQLVESPQGTPGYPRNLNGPRYGGQFPTVQ